MSRRSNLDKDPLRLRFSNYAVTDQRGSVGHRYTMSHKTAIVIVRCCFTLSKAYWEAVQAWLRDQWYALHFGYIVLVYFELTIFRSQLVGSPVLLRPIAELPLQHANVQQPAPAPSGAESVEARLARKEKGLHSLVRGAGGVGWYGADVYFGTNSWPH